MLGYRDSVADSQRVAAAVEIATRIHGSHADESGRLYVARSLAVMASVSRHQVANPYERTALMCAGVLYDVLATRIGYEDLRRLKQEIADAVGDRASSALDNLKRYPFESEDDYVARIDSDWIARRVKIDALYRELERSVAPLAVLERSWTMLLQLTLDVDYDYMCPWR